MAPPFPPLPFLAKRIEYEKRLDTLQGSKAHRVHKTSRFQVPRRESRSENNYNQFKFFYLFVPHSPRPPPPILLGPPLRHPEEIHGRNTMVFTAFCTAAVAFVSPLLRGGGTLKFSDKFPPPCFASRRVPLASSGGPTPQPPTEMAQRQAESQADEGAGAQEPPPYAALNLPAALAAAGGGKAAGSPTLGILKSTTSPSELPFGSLAAREPPRAAGEALAARRAHGRYPGRSAERGPRPRRRRRRGAAHSWSATLAAWALALAMALTPTTTVLGQIPGQTSSPTPRVCSDAASNPPNYCLEAFNRGYVGHHIPQPPVRNLKCPS